MEIMNALTRFCRSGFWLSVGLPVLVGLAACGAPISAMTPASSDDEQAVAESRLSDGDEVWVTLQNTSRIVILRGRRDRPEQESLDLPVGTGPHITTFSPDGRFAYIAGMGNGDLDVVVADSRELAATVRLGPAGTHQAKPSPDGSFLLVAQVAMQKLVKVKVDEEQQQWTVAGSVSFAGLRRAPVCTVFRDDAQRAYVSLNPTGLAIVDVPTMSIVEVLPVDGFIACGMIKARDGSSITLASSGGGGHLYRFDIASEQLTSLGTLGAVDWHSFNMTRNGKFGIGTVPAGDEVRLIDLTRTTATTRTVISLHPTPGVASDQPDAVGIRGHTAYVSLRASGKLAILDLSRRSVIAYLDLAPANPFNPANCGGCAVHGVTVRP